MLKKVLPLTAAPALWVGTALGAPSDAAGTAPVQVASSSPKSGDENELVSSSGEASYRIPFEVPPGRNGAQPRIELVYGSRSPLRGGIAAGWTLPLSKIHVDTTFGRAGGLVYAVDGARLIPSGETPSTAGGTTYRAHGDTSYTVYEHALDGEAGYWIARSPDGSVREYGHTANSRDNRTDADPGIYGGQGRWFLDHVVDVHGNEVEYQYAAYTSPIGTAYAIDEYPVAILYGRNANVSGSQHFAKIDFTWQAASDTCAPSVIPIGAQFSLRTGIRVYEGAKKLLSIRASVWDAGWNNWRARRELDLAYDANAAACGQPHAPQRVLSSAQLTAWDSAGTAKTLPATTFAYGPMDYDFAPTGATSDGELGRGGSIADKVTTVPTTNSTTADLDGNGTLETLTPSSVASGGCSMSGIPIPGFPWSSLSGPQPDTDTRLEGCFGGMQVAQRPNNDPSTGNATLDLTCSGTGTPIVDTTHERFLDMTGDGLPDLVTQRSYMGDTYDPAKDGYAADYKACGDLPPAPCVTSDGQPAACLLDEAQKEATRGLPANGAWVSYDDHVDPCAIVPDMRCGYYVMRMYKNLGNGQFATQPTMVYSPVPLDTAGHSSRLDNGALANASVAHALIDIDGDGKLDAIYYQTIYESSTGQSGKTGYSMWRGDGAGHFSSRLEWRSGGLGGIYETDGLANDLQNGNPQHYTGQTLEDINGDGLVDLVMSVPATQSSPPKLQVFYNTGTGFEAAATSLDSGTGTALAWISASETRAITKDLSTGATKDGYSVAIRRPVDIDGDGLTDVALLPPPAYLQDQPYASTASVTPYVNLGDKLVPATMNNDRTAAWYPSLLNMVLYDVYDNGSWRIGTDVRDADGDGLPEVQQVPLTGTPPSGQCSNPYFYGCGVSVPVLEATAQPYRLLTKVDNGLGVTMSFNYASARDTTVVTTTTQDGAHRIQSPLQVVKEIDVASTTAPTATTTFSYQNPLTAPDAFGRTGFRGFEQVTENGPVAESGAQKTSVRRYDYSLDKSGRLRELLTLDTGKLVALGQTIWAEELTTSGNVASFVPAETWTYACSPRAESLDAAEADCIHDGLFERHVATWSAVHAGDTDSPGSGFSNAAPAVAYLKTMDRRTASGGDIVAGDRADETAFDVHYGTGVWLLLPRVHQTLSAVNAGSFSGAGLLSMTSTAWDTGLKALPVSTCVVMQSGICATTTRTFDAYGNVATSTRPNQQGQSTPLSTSTTYDAFGMYPIAVTNELGQRVERTWDIALGLTTEVRGPLQGTVMPKGHTTYDAFGRAVSRTRLKNIGNSAPTDVVIYTASYGDTLADHSETECELLDYSGSGCTTVRKEVFDGFGRVVLEKHFTSSTTSEDTTHRYDAAGNQVEVDVPNPTGSTPATVAYTWGFDGIGRVTREDSPLRATRTTQYDALTTTISESPTDDSVPYRKTLWNDAFGRLVRVMEGITTGAMTFYWYDAADRTTNITDADGVQTAITYTLGGQRASVTRAGSTTSYDYDLDGNRIAVHHPRPAGVSDTDPAWISTSSYDALDRVAVEVPATRDLLASEQARYMSGATRFTYDEAARQYGVGRLTTVVYQFGTVNYDYSIEGWVAGETRNLHVAPDGATMTASGRMLTTAYQPFGAPKIVWYPDDATYATSAKFTYDWQDRPNRVDLGQNGNGFVVGKVLFNRNAAGYVRSRSVSGSSVADETFTFDSAGRLTNETISGYMNAGDTTMVGIAGESMGYGQDSNVRRFTQRGGTSKFDLTYDDLQQLKSVSGGSDYTGAFTYSATGKLLSASAQSSGPTAQVANRNVTYDFNAGDGNTFSRPDVADPAAVRRLKNTDGTTFASFAYDESSNLRSRTVGGATTTFSYDGHDELREAANPTGDEIYFYDYTGERILTYRVAVSGSGPTLRHRFGTTETVTDGTVATTTTDVPFGGHPVLRVTNHNVAAPEALYSGALGSLLAVLDSSKVMRARYRYAPWGEILAAEGPDAASFDHTYEDKARDTVTGLSYFGRRYYDPLTLNWTQADPLFRNKPDLAYAQPRRMSLFTFVTNSPMNLVDPNGLDNRAPSQPITNTSIGMSYDTAYDVTRGYGDGNDTVGANSEMQAHVDTGAAANQAFADVVAKIEADDRLTDTEKEELIGKIWQKMCASRWWEASNYTGRVDKAIMGTATKADGVLVATDSGQSHGTTFSVAATGSVGVPKVGGLTAKDQLTVANGTTSSSRTETTSTLTRAVMVGHGKGHGTVQIPRGGSLLAHFWSTDKYVTVDFTMPIIIDAVGSDFVIVRPVGGH